MGCSHSKQSNQTKQSMRAHPASQSLYMHTHHLYHHHDESSVYSLHCLLLIVASYYENL